MLHYRDNRRCFLKNCFPDGEWEDQLRGVLAENLEITTAYKTRRLQPQVVTPSKDPERMAVLRQAAVAP